MKQFTLILIIIMAISSIYFSGNNVRGEMKQTPNLLPNVSPEMLKAEFWIDNTANAAKVVLSEDEINVFNQRTRLQLPNTVYDLSEYPDSIAGTQLRAMIQEYQFPAEQRFANGNILTSKYRDALAEEINMKSIGDKPGKVEFGFTLKRANLRTFPTDDFVTSSPAESESDLFQETAVECAEPIIVLHKGASGRWLFVQTSNYRGWLDAASVVLAQDRSTWQEYVRTKDFLMVTASSLTIGKNTFGMGAKIALVKAYNVPPWKTLVSIPAKDAAGNLYFEVSQVDMSRGIMRGYLPYTRANVIKQAFKMLGEPYDWGGRRNWRDCSSFIQDIYRVFGFNLPRNADEQENSAGKTVKFTGGLNAREDTMKNLKPGATLHMNGHVLLYLGEYNQKHYAIHALSGYNDTNGTRVPAKAVVVSDLSLRTRGGSNYLEVLTVGKNIEFNVVNLTLQRTQEK